MTENVTNATALLYMGRGTVPRHEAIDMPRPMEAPIPSMVIIGQIDAPPSSGTAQNSGVPNTRYEATKMATANETMSEMRTDLKNFRPMASYDTLQ
jgi:hypothetical protein